MTDGDVGSGALLGGLFLERGMSCIGVWPGTREWGNAEILKPLFFRSIARRLTLRFTLRILYSEWLLNYTDFTLEVDRGGGPLLRDCISAASEANTAFDVHRPCSFGALGKPTRVRMPCFFA